MTSPRAPRYPDPEAIRIEVNQLNKELAYHWGEVLAKDDPLVLLMAANQLMMKASARELGELQKDLQVEHKALTEAILASWEERMKNAITQANDALAEGFWARYEAGTTKMNQTLDGRIAKVIDGKTEQLLKEVQELRKETQQARDGRNNVRNALLVMAAAALAAMGAYAVLAAQ